MIDGKSDAVIASVTVASHPYSIAADSVAGKIYVTHTSTTRSPFSTQRQTRPQSSARVSRSPHRRRRTSHYLPARLRGRDLKIIDGNSQAVLRQTVGMHAWGMTRNPMTGVLYIAKVGDSQIAALHAGDALPGMLTAGSIPCAIAVNTPYQRALRRQLRRQHRLHNRRRDREIKFHSVRNRPAPGNHCR